MFKDGNSEAEFHHEGPSLHHFRSSSIQEEQYLEQTWGKSLRTVKLPHLKVIIYSEEGNPESYVINHQFAPQTPDGYRTVAEIFFFVSQV